MEVEQDSATPERVGAFRILRRLATGGTADVLLARAEGPLGFERVVVLKVLLDAYRADPEFERMFAREASAYARLSHPGIVKLYDFFSAGDQLVMVLEFVDGLPLNRLRALLNAQGTELDDRGAAYLASRIFSALAAAHSARDPETAEFAPVIHRDVNPSNVLLPWDGHVKLADFGIAKVTGLAGDTKTGFIKGTFGYMAPEQVKGEPVSVRADVYAGSLLLWELLAHRKAIQHNALPEMEVLRAMAHPNIVSLDVLRPDLPAALRNAVARGLEPQEAKRSITAEEMVTILRSSMPLEEGRVKLVETLAVFRPRADDLQADTVSGGSLPRYPAEETGERPQVVDEPPLTQTLRADAPLSLSDLIETTLEGAQFPGTADATGQSRVEARPAAPSLPRYPDVEPTETKVSPSADRPPPPRASAPAPRPVTAIFGGAAASSPAPALDAAPRFGTASPPRPAIPRPGPPSSRPSDAGVTERARISEAPETMKGLGLSAPPSAIVVPSRPAPLSGPPPAVSPAPTPGAPSASGPPPSPLWSSPPPALSDPYAPGALNDDLVAAAPTRRRRGRAAVIVAIVFVVLAVVGGGAVLGVLRFRAKPRAAITARTTVSPAPPPRVLPPPPAPLPTPPAPPPVQPTPPTPVAAAPSSDTLGTLKTPRSAGGHRVFVDGKLVGQGTGSFRVPCGRHTIKVGSSGAAQALDVPCGGEVTAR